MRKRWDDNMKAQIKRPSKREREILSFVAKTNFAFFLLLSFSYKHVGGHAIVAVRGSLRRASIWKLLNRVVLQSSYLPIPCLCSASLSFFSFFFFQSDPLVSHCIYIYKLLLLLLYSRLCIHASYSTSWQSWVKLGQQLGNFLLLILRIWCEPIQSANADDVEMQFQVIS